jgi:hypothetical protein
MLDTRRNSCMGFEPKQPHSNLESVNEFTDHMALGIEEAKVALTKAKDEYTMYYNRQHEPALVSAPGDKVWLDGSDIATNRPSSKLSHGHLCPFVIEACVSLGAYHLACPPNSAAFTPSSPWSSCFQYLLIPSLADDLHHPHPELSSMVRKSMRSRRYWTAACITTDWSTWSSSRVMTSHNQWEVHTQVHAKLKIVQFHRKYPGTVHHIDVAIFDSIPFTKADLATSWQSSHF